MMHSACDLHGYTFMGRNSPRGVAYLGGSQLSGERRHFTVYNPERTHESGASWKRR